MDEQSIKKLGEVISKEVGELCEIISEMEKCKDGDELLQKFDPRATAKRISKCLTLFDTFRSVTENLHRSAAMIVDPFEMMESGIEIAREIELAVDGQESEKGKEARAKLALDIEQGRERFNGIKKMLGPLFDRISTGNQIADEIALKQIASDEEEETFTVPGNREIH